jgi:hypothetical protein
MLNNVCKHLFNLLFLQCVQTKRTKKAGIVGKYGTYIENMSVFFILFYGYKLTL